MELKLFCGTEAGTGAVFKSNFGSGSTALFNNYFVIQFLFCRTQNFQFFGGNIGLELEPDLELEPEPEPI